MCCKKCCVQVICEYVSIQCSLVICKLLFVNQLISVLQLLGNCEKEYKCVSVFTRVVLYWKIFNKIFQSVFNKVVIEFYCVNCDLLISTPKTVEFRQRLCRIASCTLWPIGHQDVSCFSCSGAARLIKRCYKVDPPFINWLDTDTWVGCF